MSKHGFYTKCVDVEKYHDAISKLATAVKALERYGEHESRCILHIAEATELFGKDGYRTRYRGKWYEAKPVDKTPKCECGLDQALAEIKVDGG